MKVNLLIVATAKYTQFLPGLLDSAAEHFLTKHEVMFCVFTDKVKEVMHLLEDKPYWSIPNPPYRAESIVRQFLIEHKPWPHSTLARFHFFKEHREEMPEADYFVYVDVDAIFQSEISDEILEERVSVQHCGYCDHKGLPFESNPLSKAYVAPGEGKQYFGGGFWGFSSVEFWKLVDAATLAIDTDEANGIVPVWNDESFLNRYLIDNPPTKVLSPSYHYPEAHEHIYGKWRRLGMKFDCKILLLSKDHKKMRE